MVLRRPHLPGIFSAAGRRYWVEVELRYAGRAIADDTARLLDREVRRFIGKQATQLTLTVSQDGYSRVTVHGVITAGKPLVALTQLDVAVDDALAESGLFEEFDVTGKVLRAAPFPTSSVAELSRIWIKAAPLRSAATAPPAPRSGLRPRAHGRAS